MQVRPTLDEADEQIDLLLLSVHGGHIFQVYTRHPI
jgi:hypothetical protein